MADSCSCIACVVSDSSVTFELPDGSTHELHVSVVSRSSVLCTALITQDEDGRFLVHAPCGFLECWLSTVAHKPRPKTEQDVIERLQVLIYCLMYPRIGLLPHGDQVVPCFIDRFCTGSEWSIAG